MKFVQKDSTTKAHQVYMLKLPNGFTLQDIGRYYLTSVIQTANVLYQYGLVSKPVQIN